MRNWQQENSEMIHFMLAMYVLMDIVGMAAIKVSLIGIPLLRHPCSTK
jgi:uncharacterized membrane protein SirB2